jgi:hypothetical protein
MPVSKPVGVAHRPTRHRDALASGEGHLFPQRIAGRAGPDKISQLLFRQSFEASNARLLWEWMGKRAIAAFV